MHREKMVCPDCGAVMNHHANKIEYGVSADEAGGPVEELGGALIEAHSCPACGRTATRPAAVEG